jgi:peptidyl-tRNA hydrolase
MVSERWLDFVLHDFYNSEKSTVVETLDLCCDAVTVILEEGVTAAMNRFNKKQKLVDQ